MGSIAWRYCLEIPRAVPLYVSIGMVRRARVERECWEIEEGQKGAKSDAGAVV